MHRIGGPLEVTQIPSQGIPQGVSPADKHIAIRKKKNHYFPEIIITIMDYG